MKNLVLILMAFLMSSAHSQEVFTISGDEIVLNNGSIERKITLDSEHVRSYGLYDPNHSYNFISDSREFSFLINSESVDGLSGWELVSTKPIREGQSGKGLAIVLRARANGIIFISNYIIYFIRTSR